MEHEAAGVGLSRVVGDVGEDIKVTAHVHALGHADPHGHPRLLFLSQLIQVVGPFEGFSLLWGPCGNGEESSGMAEIGTKDNEAEAGRAGSSESWGLRSGLEEPLVYTPVSGG